MKTYAVLPLADYDAVCSAIRNKAGSSSGLKSGQLASAIDTIPEGESISDGIVVTARDENGHATAVDFYGATNATVIVKASEATTYGGLSYYAGDTMITSSV